MDAYKLLITGGTPLVGETCVSGGKNTSVAVIPAMLLCDEPCTVENLPDIEDVRVLVDILSGLGAQVDYQPQERRITVDPRTVSSNHVPYSQTQRMRASYYMLDGAGGIEQITIEMDSETRAEMYQKMIDLLDLISDPEKAFTPRFDLDEAKQEERYDSCPDYCPFKLLCQEVFG